jgi:hypothetical protein
MGKSSSSSDGRTDKTGKADKDKNKQNQKERDRLAKEKADKAKREKRVENRAKQDDGLGSAVSAGASAAQATSSQVSPSAVSSPADSPSKKRSGDEIENTDRTLRRGSKQRRRSRPVESRSDSETSEVSASSSEDEQLASGAAVFKADARKAADLLKKKANIPVNHHVNSLHT